MKIILKFLVINFLICSILTGCKKEVALSLEPMEHQAIISGYLLSDEVCESGFVINLITDPPTLMPMYALSLPLDSDIDSYTLFPINVAIQFEKDTTACYNNYIKVHRIRIVK